MLGNELPPTALESLVRKRVDVRRFQNQQAAGLQPVGRCANKAPGRIHMLNDMKTGNDIEIRPGRSLDNILVHRSHTTRGLGQFGIGLDAPHIEMLAGDLQKVAPRASRLE